VRVDRTAIAATCGEELVQIALHLAAVLARHG
jgi:hypothetical protein